MFVPRPKKAAMFIAMDDASTALETLASGKGVRLAFATRENEEAFRLVVVALRDALRNMKTRI